MAKDWKWFVAAARAAGVSEQELFGRTSPAIIEFAASHGITPLELIEIYKQRNEDAIQTEFSICGPGHAAN